MKFFLIVALVFLSFITNAQNLKIGMESGLATFSMDGLKSINKSVLDQITFKAKQVDNFPPTIYYRPSLSFVYSKVSFGVIYTYMTTGSRISSKDYSGEYRFDINTHAHSPSIHIDYKFEQANNIDYYFRLIGGLNLSKVTMLEFLELNKENLSNDNMELISTNAFIEPGLHISYPYKKINIEANLGYHIVLGNEALYVEDNTEIKLQNPEDNSSIKPDWNGIRLGIGISYQIGKK